MKQLEVNYKSQRMIRMEMRDKKNPTNLNLPKQLYPYRYRGTVTKNGHSPVLHFYVLWVRDSEKILQRKVRALEGGNEALTAWAGVMEDYYRLVYRRHDRDFSVINIHVDHKPNSSKPQNECHHKTKLWNGNQKERHINPTEG